METAPANVLPLITESAGEPWNFQIYTLGHYLTVINVQLERALAFRNRNPQQADQAASDAKRLASEALQDIRRSVGALRTSDETFSFSAAMADLVEHVRSNILSIEVNIAGSYLCAGKWLVVKKVFLRGMKGHLPIQYCHVLRRTRSQFSEVILRRAVSS